MMSEKNQRLRVWVFTLNNYVECDCNHILSLVPRGIAKWVAFAKEVGAGGTPHLQGIISFPRPMRMNTAKRMFQNNKVHIERCVSVTDYFQYIRPLSKGGVSREYSFGEGKHFKEANPDDAYFEAGDIDIDGSLSGWKGGAAGIASQVSRLEEWMDLVDSAEKPDDPLLLSHPMSYQPGYLSLATARIRDKRVEKNRREYNDEFCKTFVEFRPWQVACLHLIDSVPRDTRRVIYIRSDAGGTGKTTFGAIIHRCLGFQVLTLEPAKDLARHLDVFSRDFYLDLSRDVGQSDKDYNPYHLMEMIKNGNISNPKYDGKPLYLPPNRLVVTGNASLDFTRISRDRFIEVLIVNNDQVEIYDHAAGSLIPPNYVVDDRILYHHDNVVYDNNDVIDVQ